MENGEGEVCTKAGMLDLELCVEVTECAGCQAAKYACLLSPAGNATNSKGEIDSEEVERLEELRLELQ